jgi:endonuclease YncB( thermonuclease family)
VESFIRDLSFAAFAHSRRGGALIVGGVLFAGGLVAGAAAGQSFARHATAPAVIALTATPAAEPSVPSAATPIAQRLDRRIVYPADVLRVIDGDTFEARVRVWPGLDVDTKVRLRGIDAAELHARCPDELTKAQAARVALETILAEGDVTVSQVGVDKYGGRVDALASTRNTPDVSAAMLRGGWARAYVGGRRAGWCG